VAKLRNIFACLVHEQPECIIDLVRNLRALDPDSLILLYNGGGSPDLLTGHFPFGRYGAEVHPSPRPLQWGHLHPFALDCISWAIENHPFDTLTIVDSDQLAVRDGYSPALASYLANAPRAGMLGNSTEVQKTGTRISPAQTALQEIDLWRPFLRQFPAGEAKFVHWCFWPSTVFLADAARELVRVFRENECLRGIMEQTKIWATEEIILPTLVSLLGFEVGLNPFSYEYVQYRAVYQPQQVSRAFEQPKVYWMHPVPRRYDHPIRKTIRERWKNYVTEPQGVAAVRAPDQPPLLLTLPLLEQMRRIDGWLEDVEADLLIAAVSRAISALPEAPTVVEVGSYCGRGTVVLGAALRGSGRTDGRVYAVDPHDGMVGSLDRMVRMPPTLERFRRNIQAAGLTAVVETVVKPSFEVEWNRPIGLLVIDGLHDYASVARDFYQFERWIPDGGLVAFHDYADYYPGVKAFVDELVASGVYARVHLARTMILLQKLQASAISMTVEAPKSTEAPAVIAAEPLVSCIMATADRRAFVPQAIRYFQRQDYERRELLILDDGADAIDDLVPRDDRIRYIRLPARRTMGVKHNMACDEARGDIVLHWDDDDWMAPWRISYQAAQLRNKPVNTLSGLSHLLFWDPRARSAWEYVYPPADKPWVAGGTFCYYRKFFEGRRFPDMNEGADTVFVWGLQDSSVLALPDHGFYVALVHQQNTSRKRTNTFGWRPVALHAVEKLLGGDLEFYGGLTANTEG
jgi:hypothetical protein